MAEILAATDTNIDVAAQRLREGKLVAMPTETVYGLGADALNDAAAKRIFAVKGRPATDPLIVHIVDTALMHELWDVSDAVHQLAAALASAFWPGPLTLVAHASAVVPTSVTGGSGFVGLRHPAHPVAQQLIRASKTSIAAPSANTFGHVSPTTAAHVMADLASRDDTLTVVDGGSCGVGIESTVLKLQSDGSAVEVLRRGAVSAAAIGAELYQRGLKVDLTIRDTRSKYASPDAAMDGPGQLLTHYSPAIPAFLVTPDALASIGRSSSGSSLGIVVDGSPVALKDVVVVDFNGALATILPNCLATRSLSARGAADEACREVFDALRWTETVKGARAAVFPLLSEFSPSNAPTNAPSTTDDALLEAVEDRLFRAASGRVATFASAVAVEEES